MKRLSVCIVLLLLSSSTAFANLTGLVVSILDGDTITVLKDGEEEVIRLNGIDCPEKNQVYGNKAKQYTSNRALDTVVTVEAKEIDRDIRSISSNCHGTLIRTIAWVHAFASAETPVYLMSAALPSEQ